MTSIERRWLFLSLALVFLLRTPPVRGGEKDVLALAARIDQRIAAAWDKGVQPAAPADDAEFFRRVHLDLAGRIPSIVEIRDFLDDPRPDKRRRWVDRILQGDADDLAYREAYSNHFANLWRDWLLAQTNREALSQQADLEQWLRQRLKANMPYDQLVRELLTQPPIARRLDVQNGTAAGFYQANGFQAENLAANTARLFLGLKLECAQCHAHPFASWTREQFWSYAAFFADVPLAVGRDQAARYDPRSGIKIAGTDKVVQARFPDGTTPTWKDENPRQALVEWMTNADNPYFARAAVNRLWLAFFGRGLVEQLDGPADEGIPNHRELLDELARAFVAHHQDLKFLIRALVASQTYQRSSAFVGGNPPDPRLFARMPLRGLSSEQLFDSLVVATEYPDTSSSDSRDRRFLGTQSPRAQFQARFPNQDLKTEHQTSILQALYLMNSEFIGRQTSLRSNPTLATLVEQQTSTARKVESLFLVVLSRRPQPQESQRFAEYITASSDPKAALEDLFWVLLNGPEFILNH